MHDEVLLEESVEDPEQLFVRLEGDDELTKARVIAAELAGAGAKQNKRAPGNEVAPRRDHRRRLVEQVEEWLASGKSFTETVDLCVAATGCHPSTAASAIGMVRARWKAADEATIEDRRARFKARIEHAWNKALDAGDFRAIAVLARTLADVEGVRAPKEVKLSGSVGVRPVAAMTPEERRKEIEELTARRAAAGGLAIAAPANTHGAFTPAVPPTINIEAVALIPTARKDRP